MAAAPLQRSLQKYAFGQVLSIILASTGLINGWLFERKSLNIPAVQAALTYTLILAGSLLYLLWVKPRKNSSVVGVMKKHKTILLGSVLFDVAANWLVVKAFSELKIPEVMVFSGISTPAAILMACIWTRPRPKYTRMQAFGVLLAMSAILFYFYISQTDHTLTKSVAGILCAVLSAISYAASNNFQERVAQIMEPVEFLLGLGSIGSLISWVIVLGSFEEVRALLDQFTDPTVMILISCYAIILSSFYLLIPVYMSRHSAVSFNFSLLAANFLGIMASWWLLDASYSSWLYVSVIFINLGLLAYYAGEESSFESKIKVDVEKTAI